MSSTNSSSSNTGLGSGFGAFPGIQNYIGPPLLAAFLQALQTGVIINQAITFIGHTMANRGRLSPNAPYRNNGSSKHSPSPYRSSPTVRIGERSIMKFIAIFSLAMAMTQTASTFYASWFALVTNFGNWVVAINVYWPAKLQSIIIVLLASPVQCFLTWRCWLLTNRNKYILMTFVSFMLATFAISIVLSVNLLRFDFSSVFTPEMAAAGIVPPPPPVNPLFIAFLVIPAMLDICLTSIMLSFLLRSRTVVVSRRFRKTLHSIIIITWEAALPPCLCAVTTMILYFTLPSTFWCLMLQSILGQLYTISLFVTLNGFNDLKDRDRDVDPTTALGYSWSGSKEQVRQRREITSGQHPELTMTIEIPSSLESGSRQSRHTSSLTQSHSPRSPRLQLTFPPVHTHHLISIPKDDDTDVSPTRDTSKTNTNSYSIADSKHIDCEKLEGVAETQESGDERKSDGDAMLSTTNN